MSLASPLPRTLLPIRFPPVSAALVVWVLVVAPASGQVAGSAADDPLRKPTKPASGSAAVEVRFTDSSALKLTLRDERLEITTRYGKLLVPVADIAQIDFATRLPDDVARRITTAIADLGSQQFRAREAASAELLKLGAKAYPALLQAAKQKDIEVARRAREVLDKLRETVPEEQLAVREHDVVYTADSKFTGRIEVATLKAYTSQFGEVQLKLTDLRGLRSLSVAAEPVAAKAEPDPGTLDQFKNQIGKTFSFKVTGSVNNTIWGSDIYTSDSPLATVAVHAGILQPGQTGVVKVKIVAPLAAYQGTTRSGVTSQPWPAFDGAYMVSR